jgi:hypothetical protein
LGRGYFTFCGPKYFVHKFLRVCLHCQFMTMSRQGPPYPFKTGHAYQHKHQCAHYRAQNAIIKMTILSVLLLPTYTPL